MTAEDYAPYGVGEPDADGWYQDYRIPASMKAAAPAAVGPAEPDVDRSWLAIVAHWRLVVAELAMHGIDLYDPAVLARPWPGIRTLIFALLEQPTELRRALTRR